MNTSGETVPARFVVLIHEFALGDDRALHWDLMFEENGRLLTWALPEFLEAGKSITASRLPDHRMKYLDYEGPISDGRGSVSRVLEGVYNWKKVELKDRTAILKFETRVWEIKFQSWDEPTCLILISEM